MFKATAIFLLFTLTQLSKERLFSQTYTVQSADGQSVKLKLSIRTWDQAIIISSAKGSLILPDCLELIDVLHLNKRFLEITYTIDGGTGILLTNTVILSVQKNKDIIPSLVFNSGLQLDWHDTKKSF